eukprot:TRINITY_DN19899_c0_g1_i2.p1 TRINITY_DN19899_c0_g1~~TRINITY_DN19899_c0_g1_i2.p1  ORF type:complete len:139 (-),score=1.36 TRINITY_DN19899_c0_g1_i2:25-381(-)
MGCCPCGGEERALEARLKAQKQTQVRPPGVFDRFGQCRLEDYVRCAACKSAFSPYHHTETDHFNAGVLAGLGGVGMGPNAILPCDHCLCSSCTVRLWQQVGPGGLRACPACRARFPSR